MQVWKTKWESLHFLLDIVICSAVLAHCWQGQVDDNNRLDILAADGVSTSTYRFLLGFSDDKCWENNSELSEQWVLVSEVNYSVATSNRISLQIIHVLRWWLLEVCMIRAITRNLWAPVGGFVCVLLLTVFDVWQYRSHHQHWHPSTFCFLCQRLKCVSASLLPLSSLWPPSSTAFCRCQFM